MSALRRMSYAEYAALPGLRWSRLSRLRRSRLHYEAPEGPSTPSLALGSALHALMAGEKIVAYPGPVRRGKAWEDFRDEHEAAGALIVTRGEFDRVERMAGNLLRHPIASSLLERMPHRELVAQWEHGGRWCKARFDASNAREFADLKMTRDVRDRQWGNAISTYGYVHQMGWYRRGFRAAHGRDPEAIYLIAVESTPPFDVRADEIDAGLLTAADRELDRLVEELERPARSWKGVAPELGSVAAFLPEWWTDDDATAELTLGGESVVDF